MPNPLQKASGPSGPKCPGKCPTECPRKSGCPRECLGECLGGVSGPRAPECPKGVPRVSPECPGHLFWHSGDTLGTPFGHSGARRPEGPRDTRPDTPSDTPIFGDTVSDTPRETSGPEGPKSHVGGWACLSPMGPRPRELMLRLFFSNFSTFRLNCPSELPKGFRKSLLVSVKFVSAILGPEMGAPILWTPGKMRSFCRKNPCP